MSKLSAYRLVKNKFVNEAFTGDGARMYGGRWNNKGHPCVYCASSESLAILEVFVHIEDYSMLQSYSLFQVELARGDIEYVDHKTLPQSWKNQPAPPETADLGDKWLKSCKSLALAVPSVIVPREHNYILNTLHSDFGSIVKKAKLLEFEFDSRLKK